MDEDDECMQHAQAENDDLKTALCIEQGLDASSALLGIIGPGTFDSPWIPYEIGGARGRKPRYKPFQGTLPNPLIAPLSHDVQRSNVPAFVGLGIPRRSLDEVEKWAKSVADILQQARETSLSSDTTRRIQDRYGIPDIYNRNARGLKRSSL